MSIEIKTKNFSIRFGKIERAEVEQTVRNASIKMPKKDYTYAPLRTALLPTPAQLRSAVINVKNDPRQMMDILRRLPEADPHIFSVGNTRQLAILGYEWQIVPAEGLKDNEDEQRKCDEMQNLLYKTNFKDFLTGLTNGIVFGHAVINPVWMLDSNNKYFPQFDLLDGIHFAKKDGKVKMILDKNDKDFPVTLSESSAIVGNNDQNQAAARLAGNYGLVWLDLDEDALIIMNSVPPILKGWRRDYLGGLMRPGLYLTLLKYYSILDWAKFNEMFGMPLRVGKFDPVLSKDDAIEILKTAVQNLGTDAAAIIDKTTEIEFVSSKGGISQGRFTYEGFAEYIERKQSMAFIGQNLTAEQTGKFGSNALAQTQNLVRMDYMWADIESILPLVNKLIRKLYFFNYGTPPNNTYPQFELFTQEVKDLEMMGGVVRDLTSSGLPLSKTWAHEFFGTKPPENEEDSFGGNNNPFGVAD